MPFLKCRVISVTSARIENSKRNGLRKSLFSPTSPLKSQYRGEWKNDKKEGKGAELSKHKWLYEGDWSCGFRHGFGILSRVLADGNIWKCYEGAWRRGKKEGFGGHWHIDGGFFEGSFFENKRHGFGRMWFGDGAFYQGMWKNDLQHGDGMLVQANGNRYEGQFFRGKKEGRGIFYHLDTGQLQEGCWEDNKCLTSTVEDMYWRQSALRPTFYPIPQDKLLDRDGVIAQREGEVLSSQKEKWMHDPPVKQNDLTFSPPLLTHYFIENECS